MIKEARQMTAVDKCWDCAAANGTPHVDGCDIARCLRCGLQRISCEHGGSEIGWGQVFDGYYPGEREAAEWGIDLNRLSYLIATKQARLNPETNRYERIPR